MINFFPKLAHAGCISRLSDHSKIKGEIVAVAEEDQRRERYRPQVEAPPKHQLGKFALRVPTVSAKTLLQIFHNHLEYNVL